MIGYPIVFRCCECTVEEQTMEHLEKHIWSRHLQAFPFKCSICDFPAINALSLLEHFEQNHAQEPVEFKRNLDDEKRFRKMIAESIAIEIDETAQTHTNPELAVLEPMTIQHVLIPQTAQYEEIVEHRTTDDEDFGVMEDDENMEELLEDDDDAYGIDDLGNPVFIGAHDDDPDYLLEETGVPGTGRETTYHMKYIRTRRMDKLIDNVVVTAAQSNPSRSSAQQDAAHLDDDGNAKIERFSCDQCHKTFKFHSKLDEHRRTHLGLRPYSCPYCPREFGQKGAMKTHVRLHTGEKPFVCQWECGKSFASASARSHHERSHSGERPYLCSICGKAFTKNSHVVRHLKNIHHRDMTARMGMMPGTSQNDDEPLQKPDITPTGKESAVVHDIVEQIHEERKEFKTFAEL